MTRTSTAPKSTSPAFHEVDEPTRGADDDVDAGAQGIDLRLEPDPPVHGDDRTAALVGERAEHAVHLVRELTGRREHEPGGTAGLRLVHALDEREPEGQGLSRPGLGLAAEVAAGQRIRDGELLDRERGVDPVGVQRRDEIARDAKRLEGRVHGGLAF